MAPTFNSSPARGSSSQGLERPGRAPDKQASSTNTTGGRTLSWKVLETRDLARSRWVDAFRGAASVEGARGALHFVSQTGVGWQHTGPQQPEEPQQLDPQQLPQQPPPPQPEPPPQPDPPPPQQPDPPQQLDPQQPPPQPEPPQPQQLPQQPQQPGWQQHISQQSCSSPQQVKQSPGQHPMIPAGQGAGQDCSRSFPGLAVTSWTAAFISPPPGCGPEGQMFPLLLFMPVSRRSH